MRINDKKPRAQEYTLPRAKNTYVAADGLFRIMNNPDVEPYSLRLVGKRGLG